MTYEDFLKKKKITIEPSGFDCTERNPALFGWQNDVVRENALSSATAEREKHACCCSGRRKYMSMRGGQSLSFARLPLHNRPGEREKNAGSA